MGSKTSKILALGLTTILFFSLSVAFAENTTIDRWITTEVVQLPYVTLDDMDGNQVNNLLDNPPVKLKGFWPEEGQIIHFGPWGETRFASGSLDFAGYAASSTNEKSVIEELNSSDNQIRFAMAATYLKSQAWQKGTLTVKGEGAVKIFVDGEEILGRNTAENDTSVLSGEVLLDEGPHSLILLTAASSSDSMKSWNFEVSYEAEEAFEKYPVPSNTIDPRHPFDISDYFLQDNISDMRISHDGKYLAVDMGTWKEADGEKSKEYRLEVWDVKKNKMVWN